MFIKFENNIINKLRNIMTLHYAVSRVASVIATARPRQARFLSSQGDVALQKLRGAIEEYRLQHYAQAIPSRCKKDILRAAKENNSDRITQEGMQRVLANINMEHKISQNEMKTIFQEIGGKSGLIPTEQMMKII